MSIYEGDIRLLQVSSEWLAENPRGWIFEAYNAFGMTVLRADYATGEDALVVEKSEYFDAAIGIDREGFIVMDGYSIGIRGSELPCLLSGQIPADEKGSFKYIQRQPNSDVLYFDGTFRDLKLTVEPERLCYESSWSYYWGLVRKILRLCRDDRIIRVTGDGDFRLELEAE